MEFTKHEIETALHEIIIIRPYLNARREELGDNVVLAILWQLAALEGRLNEKLAVLESGQHVDVDEQIAVLRTLRELTYDI